MSSTPNFNNLWLKRKERPDAHQATRNTGSEYGSMFMFMFIEHSLMKGPSTMFHCQVSVTNKKSHFLDKMMSFSTEVLFVMEQAFTSAIWVPAIVWNIQSGKWSVWSVSYLDFDDHGFWCERLWTNSRDTFNGLNEVLDIYSYTTRMWSVAINFTMTVWACGNNGTNSRRLKTRGIIEWNTWAYESSVRVTIVEET